MMTTEQIRASWKGRGDLARASTFDVKADELNDQLYLIADLGGVGGKTPFVRVFRSIPLNSSDRDIEKSLNGLYDELVGVMATPQ